MTCYTVFGYTYIWDVKFSYSTCKDVLCYAAVLKILTSYAQYCAHVKDLYLQSDCSIRVYQVLYK